MDFRKTLSAALILFAVVTAVTAQLPQRRRPNRPAPAIPAATLIRILRAEDERRWDGRLQSLLSDRDARVRKRAALTAGRIGDERALPALADLLKSDPDNDVRQMAAFAIGETESYAGSDALYRILSDTSQPREISARAVEALGKIAAALPELDKERKQEIGKSILGVLGFEADPRVSTHRLTALLGLTAALRSRPEGAGPVVVKFLKSRDPRIIADALNTMARLRLKDNNEEVRHLLKYRDPIVRANAARVIGAAEDKGAFDAVLDRALHDGDMRVRVSAIRALGSLKERQATKPLLQRGMQLTHGNRDMRLVAANEVLELATTLGRINQRISSPQVELLKWLAETSESFGHAAPELEIAHARVSLEDFVLLCSTDRMALRTLLVNWKAGSNLAQGLGEVATIIKAAKVDNSFTRRAEDTLRAMLDYRNSGLTINTLFAVHSEYAIPDVLRALALFSSNDLAEVLRRHLTESDVIIRATAAELLGEQPPGEANASALIAALPVALRDKDLNDAALAILDALGKQKSATANEAIKTALDSTDHLIRRRAVALLKANSAGDFFSRIGYVQTRYTDADYRRAVSRIGKKVTATVLTSKGSFMFEFLPEDAPLNVDNFVMLARRGYFNGQTVPRVVPNFVVQTGDPRGDQNGGPGYSIRCEINEAPYDRAAVGMALSGKDTGGSQWFVTHSPQPHLDGGYTVFGRVVSGMEVVDRISRGDTIRRIIVNER